MFKEADIALITLHGVGATQEGYANDFFDRIQKKLPEDKWSRIHREQVFYRKALDGSQEPYFVNSHDGLAFKSLRKFLLYATSDAATLATHREGESSPYFRAQIEVRDAFIRAFQAFRGEHRPVVVVAQSLGGTVFSNYMWDALSERDQQRMPKYGIWQDPENHIGEDPELTAFCRGSSVRRLFTTGCNIPIFVAGNTPIRSFQAPNPEFNWINYFDKDDPLGWPLQPLSEDHDAIVQDKKINAGGLLRGATPLSHTQYWKEKAFINPLVEYINGLM